MLRNNEFDAHVPHLAIIETVSVLRGLVGASKLTESRAEGALQDLVQLPVVRHPHEPLLEWVWQLRANLTAYDATYVALAETLDATLLTCDARLARAPLADVTVELVESAPLVGKSRSCLEACFSRTA
jgi:predicted nucleic acid-binding protein